MASWYIYVNIHSTYIQIFMYIYINIHGKYQEIPHSDRLIEAVVRTRIGIDNNRWSIPPSRICLRYTIWNWFQLIRELKSAFRRSACFYTAAHPVHCHRSDWYVTYNIMAKICWTYRLSGNRTHWCTVLPSTVLIATLTSHLLSTSGFLHVDETDGMSKSTCL